MDAAIRNKQGISTPKKQHCKIGPIETIRTNVVRKDSTKYNDDGYSTTSKDK